MEEILRGRSIARGTPGYIRSDNGPEFIATAVKGWISGIGTRTAFIEPDSPWDTPITANAAMVVKAQASSLRSGAPRVQDRGGCLRCHACIWAISLSWAAIMPRARRRISGSLPYCSSTLAISTAPR